MGFVLYVSHLLSNFQLYVIVSKVTVWGNSVDKLCHTRSVAYSVELVLNKHQISGGGG